jgi:acyl carrier protein
MQNFELKDYDIEDLEDILIRIEKSFGISFVDNELASVTDFGQLSDSIINKIKIQETESCTSQQAFYKLREAIKVEIGIENIEPKTELVQIFPKDKRIKSLKKIERHLGFKLNIIGPTDFIVGLFAVLLFGSLVGFFFDWLLPLIGIGISLIGLSIANKTGTELKYKTVKQVAEKMRRENYLKSRRHPNTGNKKEIEKTIIDIFATDFDLDKSKLTRNNQLM